MTKKQIMALAAEVAGCPYNEIRSVEDTHGVVLVNMARTNPIGADERARIKRELERRLGRSVSLM